MSESPMDSRPTFGEKLAYLAAIEEKERKRDRQKGGGK